MDAARPVPPRKWWHGLYVAQILPPAVAIGLPTFYPCAEPGCDVMVSTEGNRCPWHRRAA